MELTQTICSVLAVVLLAGIFWLCTRFISNYESMLEDMGMSEEEEDEPENKDWE